MDAHSLSRIKSRLGAVRLDRHLTRLAAEGGEDALKASQRLGNATVPRPHGPVIWIHAPDEVDPAPIYDLADQLESEMDQVTILFTYLDLLHPAPDDESYSGTVVSQLAPEDASPMVERFLDHWRPNLAIFIEYAEGPYMVAETDRRQIPMILANADRPTASTAKAQRIFRDTLNKFDHILAQTDAASSGLRRLGLPGERIVMTGPLSGMEHPLSCNEAERSELANHLSARPVWLAATPASAEIEAVLQAHRHALRNSHRLLLILAPQSDENADQLEDRLVAEGWKIARRSNEEYPEVDTEIYLADVPGELGLWYRIAPLCFLGGTLTGGPISAPTAPAGLGSAMIAGPIWTSHRAILERLNSANAIRLIDRSIDLGPVVADLLAPDRAAAIAHNAWDVSSDGAEVIRKLSGLIQNLLPSGPN